MILRAKIKPSLPTRVATAGFRFPFRSFGSKGGKSDGESSDLSPLTVTKLNTLNIRQDLLAFEPKEMPSKTVCDIALNPDSDNPTEEREVAQLFKMDSGMSNSENFTQKLTWTASAITVAMLLLRGAALKTGSVAFFSVFYLFLQNFKMKTAHFNTKKIDEIYLDKDGRHLYFKYFWGGDGIEKVPISRMRMLENLNLSTEAKVKLMIPFYLMVSFSTGKTPSVARQDEYKKAEAKVMTHSDKRVRDYLMNQLNENVTTEHRFMYFEAKETKQFFSTNLDFDRYERPQEEELVGVDDIMQKYGLEFSDESTFVGGREALMQAIWGGEIKFREGDLFDIDFTSDSDEEF